jgi:hypothetical protein
MEPLEHGLPCGCTTTEATRIQVEVGRRAADLCIRARCRAAKQRGRARHASRGNLAKDQRGKWERDPESVSRANAQRIVDLSAAGWQRAGLLDIVFRDQSMETTKSHPFSCDAEEIAKPVDTSYSTL